MKLRILALSLIAVATPGCQTTGDPNSGGIFWSEEKARQRLEEQHQQLGALRAQRGQLSSESETLEGKLQRHNRITGQ